MSEKHTPQQFEHDGFNSPREAELAQSNAARRAPTMTEARPRALELADALDAYQTVDFDGDFKQAAALLRQQHEAIAELREVGSVLMNALWKSCGDSLELVSDTIESQGGNLDEIRATLTKHTGG